MNHLYVPSLKLTASLHLKHGMVAIRSFPFSKGPGPIFSPAEKFSGAFAVSFRECFWFIFFGGGGDPFLILNLQSLESLTYTEIHPTDNTSE